MFAGAERCADGAGQPAGDQGRAARRRGLQLQREDRAARRLGPLLRAVELSGGRHDGWGQIGYSATTDIAAADRQRADARSTIRSRTASCSRPATAWAADRRRRRHPVRRSEQGCAAGAAVLGRPAARAADGHEPHAGLHRPDRQQPRAGAERPTRRSTSTRSIRSTRATLVGNTPELVPNPFFGVAEAGQLARPRDDRARSAAASVPAVRQRQHEADAPARTRSTTRHHPAAEARPPALGRQLQLHLQPPERQPVRRRATTTRARPGCRTTTPWFRARRTTTRTQEYGRSLLDSPHKIVIAPTVNLPFGAGQEVPGEQRRRRHAASAAGRSRRSSRSRAGSRSASARTSPARIFLFGGTPRPNLVAGQPTSSCDGDITDRIRRTRPTTCI